jgi:hypothetical protein
MSSETPSKTTETPAVPECIGMRTGELKPVLQKWAEKHPGVPWGYLLRKALKRELKEIAGKRYAELVS